MAPPAVAPLDFASVCRVIESPPRVRTCAVPACPCRIYLSRAGPYRASCSPRTRPTEPASYAISVRQGAGMPPTSFRFRLTADTLVLGSWLVRSTPIRDFHPKAQAHAGHTGGAARRAARDLADLGRVSDRSVQPHRPRRSLTAPAARGNLECLVTVSTLVRPDPLALSRVPPTREARHRWVAALLTELWMQEDRSHWPME